MVTSYCLCHFSSTHWCVHSHHAVTHYSTHLWDFHFSVPCSPYRFFWACVCVRLVFNGPCPLWDFSCRTSVSKASLCDVDLMNIETVWWYNTYLIVGNAWTIYLCSCCSSGRQWNQAGVEPLQYSGIYMCGRANKEEEQEENVDQDCCGTIYSFIPICWWADVCCSSSSHIGHIFDPLPQCEAEPAFKIHKARKKPSDLFLIGHPSAGTDSTSQSLYSQRAVGIEVRLWSLLLNGSFKTPGVG